MEYIGSERFFLWIVKVLCLNMRCTNFSLDHQSLFGSVPPEKKRSNCKAIQGHFCYWVPCILALIWSWESCGLGKGKTQSSHLINSNIRHYSNTRRVYYKKVSNIRDKAIQGHFCVWVPYILALIRSLKSNIQILLTWNTRPLSNRRHPLIQYQ